MAKKKLTPRQEQAQKTRKDIFDAAVDLFERKGYYKVTINDICERAGVSTGAFYNHFKSKDQVIIELFLRIDSFYEDIAKDIASAESAWEKLEKLMEGAMSYMNSLGEPFTRILYHTQLGPMNKKAYMISLNRPLYNICLAFMEEGQRKGEVRQDIDARDLARVVIACHRGVLYEWCARGGEVDLMKDSYTLLELLRPAMRPQG